MRWSPTGDDPRHMRIRGTLAFVDISGFTKLTERLARKGKVGAEEMSDILSATFAGAAHGGPRRRRRPGQVGRRRGAAAVPGAGPRACGRLARRYRMRATLRAIGRICARRRARSPCGCRWGSTAATSTSSWSATRRSTASCSSAAPAPAPPRTWRRRAAAGQIGLSAATAALLPPRLVGGPLAATAGCCARSRCSTTVRRPAAPDAAGIDRAGVLPAADPGAPARRRRRAGAPHDRGRVRPVLRHGRSCSAARGRSRWPTALDDVVRNVQARLRGRTASRSSRPTSTATAARSCSPPGRRAARATTRSGCCASRGSCSTGSGGCRCGSASTGARSSPATSARLPAYLLGQGRRHQPGGAGDGQGRARSGCSPPRRSSTARSTVFRTTELPPFLVKGKSQPVRAAEIGRHRRVAPRGPDRTSPLVGRDAEMAVLRAALADVAGPARPARRDRRRAGHRQVPAGRGAADRRRRRVDGVGRRARSTSRPRRTSRSAGCCARCWPCPPDAGAGRRSHGGSSTGSR